jgi:hypothetical protein
VASTSQGLQAQQGPSRRGSSRHGRTQRSLGLEVSRLSTIASHAARMLGIGQLALAGQIVVDVFDSVYRRDPTVIPFLVVLTVAFVVGLLALRRLSQRWVAVTMLLAVMGGLPFIGGTTVRLVIFHSSLPLITLAGLALMAIGLWCFGRAFVGLSAR